MRAIVSSCITYPLKSGGGIKTNFIELTDRGPKHDRMWMLVDEKGEKLSQRNRGCEKMALITPKVHEDGSITFNAPNQEALSIPAISGNDVSEFTVHGNACYGFDSGDVAAQWFENYLGTYCRLVSYAHDKPRPVDIDYGDVRDTVSFADGMPLLVTSTSSLNALSEHFPENLNIDMDRFRPNIVIHGLEPFEEDIIYKLRIGGAVELEFVKPCARCILTTVDQQVGKKIEGSNEPMGTLVKTRRGKGAGLQGVFFGQNAIPRSLGRITVGDEVEIISTRAMHPALEEAVLKFQVK